MGMQYADASGLCLDTMKYKESREEFAEMNTNKFNVGLELARAMQARQVGLSFIPTKEISFVLSRIARASFSHLPHLLLQDNSQHFNDRPDNRLRLFL